MQLSVFQYEAQYTIFKNTLDGFGDQGLELQVQGWSLGTIQTDRELVNLDSSLVFLGTSLAAINIALKNETNQREPICEHGLAEYNELTIKLKNDTLLKTRNLALEIANTHANYREMYKSQQFLQKI